MTASPLRVSCPACETAYRLTLPETGATDSDADADADVLRGRDVTCNACEAAFEVLFYPG